MTLLIVGIILLALFAVGSVSISSRLRTIADKRSFAIGFLSDLKTYWDSRGKDERSYLSMVHKSARLQSDLGRFGVFEMYNPPGADYAFHNYPAVLNMVPELRQWIAHEETLSVVKPAQDLARTLEESIVRYLGVLDRRENTLRGGARNPLIRPREGIGELILLPLRLLGWLGIISDPSAGLLEPSVLFRVISGVITLVGLASAVMTIVVGWSQFIEIVQRWFPR